MLSLSVYNLFASNTCSLFFSHNYSQFCLQHMRKHLHVFIWSVRITKNFKPPPFSLHATRLHTRLTALLLLVVCFILIFYNLTILIQRTFLNQSVRIHYFARSLFWLQFLFVCNVHSYCIRLRCALVRFHTYTDVGLLITNLVYICVSVALVLSFLISDDITSFPSTHIYT